MPILTTNEKASYDDAVAELPKKLGTYNADKVITVGDDGDYATINEALTEASKAFPLYNQGGYKVEIKLLAGFVMQEQVTVKDMDLGHIVITGEDDETTIDAENFVDIPYLEYHSTNKPTFSAKSGTLPVIGQLFTTINGGDENNGIQVETNSIVYVLKDCGIKNAGQHGVLCSVTSRASLNGSNFSNAGEHGIYAFYSSTINAQAVDVSNAGNCGIMSHTCSTINAQLSNASNTGTYGVSAYRAATVNAAGLTATDTGSHSISSDWTSSICANYSNCSSDGDYEYYCANGSILNINSNQGDSRTNISTNSWGADGSITE